MFEFPFKIKLSLSYELPITIMDLNMSQEIPPSFIEIFLCSTKFKPFEIWASCFFFAGSNRAYLHFQARWKAVNC